MTLKAQSLKPKPIVGGAWVTEWLLCGPFDLVKNDDVFAHCTGFQTDFLKKSGGEQHLKVKVCDAVQFKGGSNTWKFYASSEETLNIIQNKQKRIFFFSNHLGSNNTFAGKLFVRH